MNEIKPESLRNGELDDVDQGSTSADDIEDHAEPLHERPTHRAFRRRKKLLRSRWLPRTTETFLNECIKRKVLLRRPRDTRHTIFTEIRSAMLEKGYNFNEKILHRKFRNLKTHFLYIQRSNRIRKSNRILWPFYEKMNEIFPTELLHRNTGIKPLNHKQTTSIDPSSAQGDNYTLESLRNELIALEERRTIAIEAIAVELFEANKLSREKLNLCKLEYRIMCKNGNMRRERIRGFN